MTFLTYDNGRSGSFTPTLPKYKGDEMDDKNFENLERTIFHTMRKLNRLQKKHRKETGVNFVISKPLPKPDCPVECNCKNDQGCFLPK